MVEGKEVDVEGLTHNTGTLRYPYIQLTELNETTPLILQCMEKGDVRLIAERNGKRKILGYISESAYNMQKILRTHDSFQYVTKEEVFTITSVREYLEVISGWML